MSLIVKICGITNAEDARVAVAAGADWLGFVFYPPSPRAVVPEQVRAIVAELPDHVEAVGVFVDCTVAEIVTMAETAGLDRVQCHGSETPAALRVLAPWRPLKAVGLRVEADLAILADFAPGMVLVDTPCPGHGGSGQTGDWELAARAAARQPLLLAGGLTADNVAAAIRRVRPAGVDVSSGVERCPGRKDHAKVCAFIHAARQAT